MRNGWWGGWNSNRAIPPSPAGKTGLHSAILSPRIPLALKRQACANHPDRDALGVCVATRQPLCSECATLHEGVLHSRQALEDLRQARTQAAAGDGVMLRWLLAAALALPMLAGMWLFFKWNLEGVIHLLQYTPHP